MIRAALFVWIALSAVAVSAQGKPRGRHEGPPPTVHPLFRKVMDAASRVRLSGVRVVQVPDQGDRRLVTEKVYRDGFRMRTEVTSTGPNKGEIAVEDGRKRLVYFPSRNVIREFPARERESSMRLGRLAGMFPGTKVSESDGGKVAGVATKLLEVTGPSGRVNARAWVDTVHWVVLRLQTFNSKGDQAGSVEYTSVDFSPSFPQRAFELIVAGAKRVTPEDELAEYGRDLGFRPYRLKAPWKLSSVRKMTPRGTKVLMSVYDSKDGHLSLFQIQGQLDGQRLKRLEGPNTHSHVWETGGYKFALIGSQTEEVLRRLASTVSG
ncbi:MAG: hypothetical protein JST30_13355 [Armatimonadetes bacterium]|nr:hypothetical protein [Armatimonadota bacterium]